MEDDLSELRLHEDSAAVGSLTISSLGTLDEPPNIGFSHGAAILAITGEGLVSLETPHNRIDSHDQSSSSAGAINLEIIATPGATTSSIPLGNQGGGVS